MAVHNQVGEIGELVTKNLLTKQGFKILEQNYRKKWGEIDIVACGTAKVHFVEVKAVSYETKADLVKYVPRETFMPEDRVHEKKRQRLSRTIETWLLENRYSGEWQIDIAVVYLVPREKYACVKLLENVIFD